MISQRNGTLPRDFVTTILPWVVGGSALLVYLGTLNRWLSFSSLSTVMQITGWTWRPEVEQPLAFALLYPFRWLPEPWIPLALNAFTAVCAAAVLTLLTRSVALLPHDLKPDEPSRKESSAPILSTPTAWMPPVLTAILVGLQLSFWEHATSASGRMIDLLVFAYVARCLLEFRVDRNQRWLSRSALVYGAGMANNWAMLGYLPVYVAAILRTKGLRQFLERRFLLTMALCGLAGMSLYLLQPLVNALSPESQVGFWLALKVHLRSQALGLAGLPAPEMRVLALTSLLPLLLLSIPWKPHTAQLGDDTPLGVFLTRATGHLAYGLFLVLPLWIAFDPTFSPRHLNMGTPMLTYYYISALVFGYCGGYFLMLQAGGFLKRFSKLPTAAGACLLLALPLALLARNLPQIRTTNGPAMHTFARRLYADLPAGQTVVLSEDGWRLLLLRAELGAHPAAKDPLLLNTLCLPLPQYHIILADKYKSRWPMTPPTNSLRAVNSYRIRELVTRFAERESVVYLHPSSGLLVEPFDVEPRGLVHALLPAGRGDLTGETLPPGVILTNEQIWRERWTNDLHALSQYTRENSSQNLTWTLRVLRFLRLTGERNLTASLLGAAYSKALDFWGVEMQRQGRWTEAALWFERAQELNPDNVSARINLAYNERRRRGDKTRLDAKSVEQQFRDRFAKFDDWSKVLNAGGPVDEPTFLLQSGQILVPGGNFRQAVNAFARCVELAPDWPLAKLWLARTYLQLGYFGRALAATDTLQASDSRLQEQERGKLLYCRTIALRRLHRGNEAATLLADYVNRYRQQNEVLATAAVLYGLSRQFEPELDLLEELLKREPDRVDWLVRKGLVQLQLSRFDAALATLNKALALAPSNDLARLYRAVARLGAAQLEPAREDYRDLLRKPAYERLALFGLGEIAWRQRDTNEAIQYYQEYLSKANPRAPQYAHASQRLNELAPRTSH